jgi:hypothetical protein
MKQKGGNVMKRMIIILMSFLICIASVDFSFAGNLGKYMSTVKVSKHLPGTIGAIDIGMRTLTIKIKANDIELDRVFVFNEKTSVMKGTEQKTINDLKSGDVVTVVYVREGDKNLAEKILIEK